jgi:hypothetical protein
VPFTPFHFGVGLAAKAVLSRRFSLSLFIALQVVIDLESLYNLTYHREHVHRTLHTFVGATLLALASSALLCIALRWHANPRFRTRAVYRLFAFFLATSLFATWSHVVLDSIMHRDIQPLWPITALNPLRSLVGTGLLHLGCLALGFFGLVLMVFRWSLHESDVSLPGRLASFRRSSSAFILFICG